MKTGKSLVELATEIQRRAANKKDLVANTKDVVMQHGAARDGNPLRLCVGDDLTFAVNNIAHAQIAGHTEIPKAYYDKMQKDAPGLLATNVNEWFRKYPVKAQTPNDIIRAAISQPGKGLASGKKSTRLLYSDVELLKAALQ